MLTSKPHQVNSLRRTMLVAFCGLLALGTCTSALALRVGLNPSFSAPQHDTAATVIPGGVIAGNILTKVMPKYPQEAKDAHIAGAVVLNAIISKTGTIESLDVVSGPPELRASAIEAVRQWTYKPYLMDGSAVAVETTVTVTYSLER